MAAKAFVDTNILLRSLISQFPESDACKTLLIEQRQQNIRLWISRQVIRELLVQLTHERTLAIPMTGTQIRSQLQDVFALFTIADESTATTQKLLQLIEEYDVRSKQIHDANIVATMLVHEIDTLLTLNTGDFQRYQPVIKIMTIPTSP
jgi:predicted nucleic acid-binding protein